MHMLACPRADTVDAGKKNLTGLVSELVVEAECGQVREYRVVGAAKKQFTLSCRLIPHALHQVFTKKD